MESPQKIKDGNAFWPCDSTPGIMSKETRNTNLKEYMHPYVHCNIIYNSQDLETAQVPINRWVDKKAMGHLHNGILPSRKKEGNLTFCDNMDGPGDYYAKWNEPVRKTNSI